MFKNERIESIDAGNPHDNSPATESIERPPAPTRIIISHESPSHKFKRAAQRRPCAAGNVRITKRISETTRDQEHQEGYQHPYQHRQSPEMPICADRGTQGGGMGTPHPRTRFCGSGKTSPGRKGGGGDELADHKRIWIRTTNPTSKILLTKRNGFRFCNYRNQ